MFVPLKVVEVVFMGAQTDEQVYPVEIAKSLNTGE